MKNIISDKIDRGLMKSQFESMIDTWRKQGYSYDEIGALIDGMLTYPPEGTPDALNSKMLKPLYELWLSQIITNEKAVNNGK